MAAMDWNGVPLEPLPGGYSGETFLAGDPAGDPEGAAVVRIYRRNPDRAVVDASLLRLATGLVPVPPVLEVVPGSDGRPGVLVTGFVGGVPLDSLLAGEAPLDLARLGHNVGRVLGTLANIPFLRFGMFADADLRLSDAGVPTDLGEWAEHFRSSGRIAAWPQRDWEALRGLVDHAQDLLDSDPGRARTVLSHSDFNPKNIRVDADTLEIVGVLDWEFAHAGSRYTDLGNFTRFERDERLVTALLDAFLDRAPGPLELPVERARAVDLWALLELAGGARTNPVRELAAELLLAQARAQSLDAWPWDTRRVDPRPA
jgi:aminoglycoside phosphotransferase (APT) family kinase protein